MGRGGGPSGGGRPSSAGRSFSSGGSRSFGGRSSSPSRGSSTSASSSIHRGGGSPSRPSTPSYSAPKPSPRPSTPPVSRPAPPPPPPRQPVAPPPPPTYRLPVQTTHVHVHEHYDTGRSTVRNEPVTRTESVRNGSGYREPVREPARKSDPGGLKPRHIVITVIAMVVLFMIIGLISGSGGKASGSTVERTRLEGAPAFSRDCVDDLAEWSSDKAVLLRGMESFYKSTGVQPALVIATDIDGDRDPADGEIEAFASREYDKLVGHEKGVLLLFVEWFPNEWNAYYMAGKEAQTVMDSEACDILMDYVEAYYVSDMTEDEYFSAVFAETGERIMTVMPTPASKLPWMIAAIVIVAGSMCAVMAVQTKARRAREEAEETERLLHTHVDRL